MCIGAMQKLAGSWGNPYRIGAMLATLAHDYAGKVARNARKGSQFAGGPTFVCRPVG